MSDQPTRETNEAQFGTGRVSVDFARRLERERDEARGLLAKALARGDEAMEDASKARKDLAWSDIQDKVELVKQRDEAREQLDSICREGFGYQDTISLEPCADYVLRKLKEERELARELRDAMKAITPYIGYPSTPTDVIYQFKNTLTKAKEVLP